MNSHRFLIVMHYRPRHRFEKQILIGEPGVPAILGHTTDVSQSKNAEFSIHTSTTQWLAQHGRVPVEILNRAGIPDDFGMDRVGKAVADLKY